MDILNFISWIRSGRVVNTVNPAQTLLPVGLKDNRRDDGYLAGAISVEDLVTQLTPTPTYKVFTALLTQSGGDNVAYISSDDTEPLVVGVTYKITFNNGGDFTNVGAPNNNVNTFFIATGTTPNSWGVVGDTEVSYNTGAPVATVLENTIGNIWFEYIDVGNYSVNSDALFIESKTMVNISSTVKYAGDNAKLCSWATDDSTINGLTIQTQDAGYDDILYNTPIEIRVYE